MRDINEIQKIFVERLKELIKDADPNKEYNQSYFSKSINIPYTTINSWMNLKRTPQIDSLDILADYFGVTVDYLLGREN